MRFLPCVRPRLAHTRPNGGEVREGSAEQIVLHSCSKESPCSNASDPMYLAVPLSWSLSLVRPVTLRPNLSVGLPFYSYSATVAALLLLCCCCCPATAAAVAHRSATLRRHVRSSLFALPAKNFSCLNGWSSPQRGQGQSQDREALMEPESRASATVAQAYPHRATRDFTIGGRQSAGQLRAISVV
jgi:hypothetical protein